MISDRFKRSAWTLLCVLVMVPGCRNNDGPKDAGLDPGTTIPCDSDAECPSNLPTCHPNAKICIGCQEGSDTCAVEPGTPTIGPKVGTYICDPAGSHKCIPRPADYPCKSNADCSGKTTVCVQDMGKCVECLSSRDCASPTPFCDSFYPAPVQIPPLPEPDGGLTYTCSDGCTACRGALPNCQRDMGVCCPADPAGACVQVVINFN